MLIECLTKTINIFGLNYKNDTIQNNTEEQKKIGKIIKTLIKAFKELE